MIAIPTFPTFLRFPLGGAQQLLDRVLRAGGGQMNHLGGGASMEPLAASVVAQAWTPANITGLLGWESDFGVFQERTGASATTPAIADTDPVGTWKSKYGVTHYLTAASNGVRPTNQTNEINGLPVLRWDGINDYFNGTFASAMSNADLTLVVVTKWAGGPYTGIPRTIFGSEYTRLEIIYVEDAPSNTVGFYRGNVSTFTNGLAGLNYAGTNILVAKSGGTGINYYKNGGTSTFLAVTLTTTITNFLIGARSPSENRFNGDIGALYLAPNFSLANLNLLGAYLQSKYGITWTTAT